ncbi:hypothetical protein C6P40_003757 [Pichia californica]|uniref:CID domain-containing protein n=1 Tax=Pichia californica TaxID=460514 RepID=A0A9P7BGJ5_9ASCO|nr:hypothetical protein C6P42_001258 [[Candida] californica]KAG0690136.1 hypothetical protein C6P40_003757 [[Candida] californica]
MSSNTTNASEILPNQFEEDYYNSLQQLTFNSRPIIESHTNLAQENNIFAPQVVSAIEKRIDKAIPSQKLFALYLLDSISKNIGLPYTSLFSNNIFKVFTRAYGLVDDETRCKMIKLFKTWKMPTALTGLPIFDPNQLDKVEQFLIKVTASSNPGVTYSSNDLNGNQHKNINARNASPVPITNNLSVINQPNLIRETDELLALVNSRLQSVPHDEKGQQRFKLLNQLKNILTSNSDIPKNQLNEVAKQLQSIREDEILKLNIIKQQQAQKRVQQQQQQQQSQQKNPLFSASQLQSLLNMSNNNLNNNNLNNNNLNNNNLNNNGNPANALFNMMNSVMIQQQQQQHQSQQNVEQQRQQNEQQITPQVNNSNPLGLKSLSFLEDMLKKTARNQTMSQTVTTSSNVDFKFIRPTKEAILEDFVLTQTFINNHNPSVKEISLLYEFKPIQCDKCSKRFADTDKGLLLRNKHIEWHTRVEQRLKLGGSGLGGVVNRSWYLTQSKWIEFDDYQDDESVSTNTTFLTNGQSTSNKLNQVNDSLTSNDGINEYRERDVKVNLHDAPNHIVRIPESSSNEVVCGICREKLVGTFDEDSGDWIWKNAVEQKGKVWHWTCWEERKRSGSRRDRSPQRN